MSNPPRLRTDILPELHDYWEDRGLSVPRYLTPEQASALDKNEEYVAKTNGGTICPVCLNEGSYSYQGTRYDCEDDSYGHPVLRLVRLYFLHNIPLQYQQLSFDDWPKKPKVYYEAREAMANYIALFKRYSINGVGLTFFSGTLGTGKSWGATSVLKELVKEGVDGWFAPFYKVKSYYELSDEHERNFLTKRIQYSQLLVLDEVRKPDTDNQRRFYADKLEELIRPRTDANLPTIITTNMTPEELEEEYPRVFSLMSAKNIEISLDGMSDARLSSDVWKRNVEVAENGDAIPIV